MKLWIFNHYAISPGSGGITRDFDLAKRLNEEGHEVTIFASSFDHRTRKEKHFINSKDLYKEEYYDGIRYVWVRTTPYTSNNISRVFNIFSYSIRGYFTAMKLKEKPDVVMGTLVHPLAALLGYMVSWKKKSMFYFEERDLWPETLIHLGKLSKHNPIVTILSKLELFLYKKAKRIIVLFDKAPEYIAQRGISKNKVLYLPNGVDLDRYEESAELSPEHDKLFQGLKDKFIAMYTGAHGLANRLDVLLDVAKILKDQKPEMYFVLVGDGVEKQRLIQRKLEEGLDNVIFLDPVPKEQIPTILKKANVGLIAMWDAELYKWGISLNKAYDYMAAKIPTVIQCNIEGTIIEKSKGGIKVADKNSMAEALTYISQHPNEAKEMGENARNYVESYHSWDQMAQTLIDAMQEDVQQEHEKERVKA
ncbi:glycosyltransferase involved in cell wall biosynthesis [Bacillus mesophilus]|uniref:Glycosyltransferase family 4 protein n=1 Tax=Bacillus mesophilus TaxID=1808955 RepID=A0A6M0Q9V1_9BACI|nr:glycosyltransferase family 4 protein [Bacillus mesophilus]MBM7661621.1 glycosyltransferase involved in cell wall biosynthesis [Bacillus mesophilus]NEY72290.1 glycosyltransferase family 4 protein [Bacillus mesophilus]